MADETGEAPAGLRWVPLVGKRGFWIATVVLTAVGAAAGIVLALWYLLGRSDPPERITAAFLVAGWTFVGMGLGLALGEMVRLERIDAPSGDAARPAALDDAPGRFFDALRRLPAQRVPLALGILLLLAAAYLAKPVAGAG